MTALRNLTFVFGETCEIEHVAVDDDGNVIDLSTGVAVQWFVALDPWSPPLVSLSIGAGIVATTPATAGGLRIALSPAAQMALAARSYHHECSVKLNDGTTYGQFSGLLTLKPSVAADFVFTNVAPINSTLPAIAGAAIIGETLTASPGTWLGYPASTFTYQWQADGVDIAGATSSTYLVDAGDIGKTLTVVVTATNAAGAVTAESLPTGAVSTAASPPANVVLPAITGTPLVGSTLSASAGTWTGAPAPTFAYQWKRNGVAISGATLSIYTLGLADAGATITVTVTATNVNGVASATSGATATVNAVPVNVVAPEITGTVSVGQTLTTSNGTWTGYPAPSFTYQWQRNGADIAGATSSTYLLVLADAGTSITAIVTATNIAGSASAVSNAASAAAAPSNTVLPAITGTAQVGSTLSASNGTWTGYPAPTFAYQWKRAGVDIAGATSSTYLLVAADRGLSITVTVTATNGSGSASATSSGTSAVVDAPVNTVLPAITGTTQVGSTLTASSGTWTGYPAPTYAYQWKRNGVAISGATASTYALVTADNAAVISVTVTATNSAGSASATSADTATITQAPINTVLPAITGTAEEGQTLTASAGTWTGTATITYAYQWKRAGVAISGATSSTYLLVTADVGAAITVTVTATNGVGSASATSAATSTVIAAAVDTSTIALPANATRFWALFKRTGYSGSAIRVQRSSDNTEQDIGFNNNNMLDTVALLAFVGAGTGYVTKIYDQVGSVDAVQTTQSLMPIIVAAGVLQTTSSGLPAIRGCTGGRYMVAAGAFTSRAGLEFSLAALAENGQDQTQALSNIWSPLIGVSTAAGAGSIKATLQFGNRSSATNRNALLEFSSSSQSSNEIAGYNGPIVQFTTAFLSANVQDAALSGGPGIGTTIYYNRGVGTTVNNSLHSASAFTTATDVRLFAGNGAWSTNTGNGADAKLLYAYVGGPMTDAQRNSLESQVYDKCSKVLFAAVSASLPKLGANGEAWDFSTFASNAVAGINGKTNLQFETAANGANWTAASAPNGIAGLRASNYLNFKNDWQADSTFGSDQLTFTLWAMFTGADIIGASKFSDIIGMAIGTLGTTSGRYVSALLSKDHSPLVAYTLDTTTLPTSGSDYTNVMVGQNNPDTGDRVWLPYSPFWGGGFLGVNVPAHDNNSDHPPFYTKKKFLGNSQTTDGAGKGAYVNNGITYLMILKHRPHPNYIAAEAYDSANNVLWRNKATVEVKVAHIGGLDGFGKILGGKTAFPDRASTAVAKSGSRFRAYGGEGLAVFDGFTHACGFFGGKYTTDAEDQALFYKLNNPNNISALL